MSTQQRIRNIAAQAVRLQIAPAFTPLWKSDAEFGRRHSFAVWEEISRLAKEPRKTKPEKAEDDPIDLPTSPDEDEDEDDEKNEGDGIDETDYEQSGTRNRGRYRGRFFGYLS